MLCLPFLVLSCLLLQSRKINEALVAGGDVLAYGWTPGGGRVVYVANVPGNIRGLYSRRADLFAPARRLDDPEAQDDGYLLADRWLFAPGGRVIFLTHFAVHPSLDIDDDLFSAPLDGSEAPVLIGDASDDGWLLSWFVTSAGRVIYLQERSCCSGPPPSWHIWNAAADGSQPPFELTDTGSARVAPMHATPQEDRVVYSTRGRALFPARGANRRQHAAGGDRRAACEPGGVRLPNHARRGPRDLRRRVRCRGSRRAVERARRRRRSPCGCARPSSRTATSIPCSQLTPDGSRAVYRADQDADEVYELYSVPTLGGPSVKLSGPMTLGGDVDDSPPADTGFLLAPGGARVLYRADQTSDGVFELFSAPVDGSATAVRLHPALASDRDVVRSQFLFTLDGQRVLYVANQDTSTSAELYLAPADGSQTPIKLTPPMVANGGVRSFGTPEFAPRPDGKHVVYMADQDVDQVDELFSVPLDGSRVSRRLNGPLAPGGDVWSFAMGPTGQALYHADEEQDLVLEVFLTKPAPRSRPR